VGLSQALTQLFPAPIIMGDWPKHGGSLGVLQLSYRSSTAGSVQTQNLYNALFHHPALQ